MTGYAVTRQVIVRSSEVEKINALANNIEPFVGKNYNVSTQSLELNYSKLSELRVKLLSEAIRDAKARAEAITEAVGGQVGAHHIPR